MTREEFIYTSLQTKTITVRISQELYDKLNSQRGFRENLSDVIRKALSEYVRS